MSKVDHTWDGPNFTVQFYDDGSVDIREAGTGNMRKMFETSQEFEEGLKAAMRVKKIVSAMRNALQANQRSVSYDSAISAELMDNIHELGFNPVAKTGEV